MERKIGWNLSLGLVMLLPALMGFGACEPDVDIGGDVDGGLAYDPCDGLSCGGSCTLCAPDDPTCSEDAVLKYCHTDGACRGTAPECGPAVYVPCAGLSCGDSCRLCAPGDRTCSEDTLLKYCQPAGTCSAGMPTCP